jgi:hypothetical protein
LAKEQHSLRLSEQTILQESSVVGWQSITADQKKLRNLIRRREIYADIMQTVTKDTFFKELLQRFDNSVPDVHDYLLRREVMKGQWTMVPPAFYGRSGKLMHPPNIELKIVNSIL